MLRALSTAASGMKAQQTKLDVTANNIANVNTPGFKKTRVDFENVMVQTVRAPGTATTEETIAPTGLEVGMGVKTAGTERMQTQGDMAQTGNPLDIAILGSGFFQVQTPSGETLYTRAGNFKQDADGRVVTSTGLPLVGDLELPPGTETIDIAANGVVTATQRGEKTEVGQIEVATFANPAGLQGIEKNFFRATAASGEPISSTPGDNGTGQLSQRTLEMSNVAVVEEMIDLISGQRAYEVNSRVIRASDEMLQQAANLR